MNSPAQLFERMVENHEKYSERTLFLGRKADSIHICGMVDLIWWKYLLQGRVLYTQTIKTIII